MSSINPEVKSVENQSKSVRHLKIAVIVLAVLCVAIFITFCTILALYITKGSGSDYEEAKQIGYMEGYLLATRISCFDHVVCVACAMQRTESGCAQDSRCDWSISPIGLGVCTID